MRAVRSLITWLVFLAATGGSLAAIVSSASRTLPAMSRADMQQVWRWLESIELQTASPQKIDELLDQVLTDIGGFAREAPHTRGAPDQAQRVQRNLIQLAQHWARRSVAEYAKLPAGERPAYVDRRAADVVALQPLVSGRAWNYGGGDRSNLAQFMMPGKNRRPNRAWDFIAASAAGYQVSEELISTLPREQHGPAREFRNALAARLSQRLNNRDDHGG